MIRRKVKKKKDEKPKAKKQAEVIPQWTYIKTCTHNLKDKSCSLCKLIEIETSKYLQQEYHEKHLKKIENFYKRALMRYSLLREWSKNQLLLYSDVIMPPIGEITLCSSLLNTLTYSSENYSMNDIENINNYLLQLLEKRNRILEVGNYAATFIQCRIRGLCCRKRLTSFLLRRFEYHEENIRKGPYFLDKMTGNRFYSTPYLISHERPGSPRTIQRRITFQTKIRDKRIEKYRELCKNTDYTKEHEGGQWKSLEMEIVYARQLVVLRDLIFSLFKELSQKRRDLGERPSLPSSSSGKGNAEVTTTETPEFAYWFTLSNPAPPARQLYLSLVLETDPLETEEEIIANEVQIQAEEEEKSSLLKRQMSTKRVSINPMASVVADSTNESKEVPTIPLFDLNDRLQQLDRRIWEMMACYNANDMVAKIISCEEIQPTLSSCQQIAEDEHQIWKNIIPEDQIEEKRNDETNLKTEQKTEEDTNRRDFEVMGQYKRGLSSTSSRSVSRLNSKRGYSFDESENEEEKLLPTTTSTSTIIRKALSHGLYLPCQLQIHPFYPNRSPAGIIRLFFVDGVISAVSHTSPWVYYPEVWNHRTAIIRSICEYAESKPIKALIRTLMNRANDLKPPSAPSSSISQQPLSMSAISRGRTAPLPPTTPNPAPPPPSPPSNVISVVLPDEKTLFGNYPSLTPCTLTGSEYRIVDQKYRFLRKMKAWKDARRYTASDRKVNVPEDISSDSNPSVAASAKLTQIPAAEHLLGSSAFRLSCAEAPRESLSEETKYQLASLGGGVAYRSLLKRAANEIETKMEIKFHPPTGNEYTKNVEIPIPPPPPRNLIVIDVHVSLPSEEPSSSSSSSSQPHVKSDRRGSRLHSNAGASLGKLHGQSTSKLAVHTHQVVGIFSTATDKPPSALDTSLFTWQQLLKICTKFATLREILKSPQTGQQVEENEFLDSSPHGLSSLTPLPSISSSNTSSSSSSTRPISAKLSTNPNPSSVVDMGATHSIKFNTPLTDETLHWTLVTPESGIYGTKISLGGGLDLQVRLIGKTPEREYLEKTIPKKIRKWIGLRY